MSTHFALGVLYKKKMFYNDAVTEFKFVTSHEGLPQYNEIVKRAYVNLAEIYEAGGKRDGAIAMYGQSLRLDPGNSLIRDKIAMMRDGKELKSFEALSPVEIPNSAIPGVDNGKVQQNAPGSAVTEYEEILRVDPGNMQAHVELGRIFEDKNEPEKAIAVYKKALMLPLSPDHQMSTHFALGSLYKNKMFYDDAVTEFKFVTSHEGLPQYNDIVRRAYINLAEIYEATGKKNIAISMYEQSLRLEPGDSQIRDKISAMRKVK
jgi:tetratricopeptide (TPR) repeat protein